MGYDINPSKGMLLRIFDHFMLIYLDFRRFPRGFTRFEALGTQNNTGGIGYDSHPHKDMIIRLF